MSNNFVSFEVWTGAALWENNSWPEIYIYILQIWCDDVVSHVTMSKSAHYLCVRKCIEQLESFSHISKGNAMEHLKKSTILNSNLIGNSRATGLSVVRLLCATLIKQS